MHVRDVLLMALLIPACMIDDGPAHHQAACHNQQLEPDLVLRVCECVLSAVWCAALHAQFARE
jgi:hypothetical protein